MAAQAVEAGLEGDARPGRRFGEDHGQGVAVEWSVVLTGLPGILAGREIARLVEGHMRAGYHQVVWHGRMAAGREVPTGIYIARFVTPKYTKTIKMVMLK